jgi:transcriptional regulator with XRE-family HTH domain
MRRTISKHEEIRRLRGFTVSSLAEAIRVSHSYVSLVEGGLEKPSPRYRKAAARVLGVPEDLIFEPVTTATAPSPTKEVNSARRGA